MIKSASQQSLAESLSWVNDLNRDPETVEINDDLSSNGSTADERSNTDYVPGCFEGPEKTMEVVFRPEEGHELGLRALTREQLDFLCTKARCTILHAISNQHMDAYVLSESSLFVYKHRLIMKTCGTTTLLRCLGSLLEFADGLGMVLEWVGYSRKNLNFPTAQAWPHSSFPDEMQYLTTHKRLQNRLKGTGHILGPVTGDHWYVYVADHSKALGIPRSPSPNRLPSLGPGCERTINMMMFDMAPEVGQIFYLEKTPSAVEMTKRAGIQFLCPGAQIDEEAFTPCGYSMNAILHGSYSTIHITPEPECSYASFETNTPLDSYEALVRNVLSAFRPARFVLTLLGDEDAIDAMQKLPTKEKTVKVSGWGLYQRTAASSARVDADLACLMACYSLVSN